MDSEEYLEQWKDNGFGIGEALQYKNLIEKETAKKIFADLYENGYLPTTKTNLEIKDKWCL